MKTKELIMMLREHVTLAKHGEEGEKGNRSVEDEIRDGNRRPGTEAGLARKHGGKSSKTKHDSNRRLGTGTGLARQHGGTSMSGKSSKTKRDAQ